MEEFRNQLIAVFQSSNLPLEAKYYILKDVFRDVSEGYYTELQKLQGAKEQEVRDDAEGI